MSSSKLSIMVSGLPGKMATEVAKRIATQKDRCNLVPVSFCSARRTERSVLVEGIAVELIKPEQRTDVVSVLRSPVFAVDYTLPDAANVNAAFYAMHNIPFVMGTTGGDRAALEAVVNASKTCAVIAPNMAKPIVTLLAMIKFAAENFPNAFKGYKLEIIESHQAGKKDTSGTARAMVKYFNELGIPFTDAQIVMVRGHADQIQLGVPREHLQGHGWHDYTLRSADENVLLSFTHNVNGRSVYVDGTLDAIEFLSRKVAQEIVGQVFTMLDVLR